MYSWCAAKKRAYSSGVTTQIHRLFRSDPSSRYQVRLVEGARFRGQFSSRAGVWRAPVTRRSLAANVVMFKLVFRGRRIASSGGAFLRNALIFYADFACVV